MEIVKLSNEGQIVITKGMRDDLHLLLGTEFVISLTATGLLLSPVTFFPKTEVPNLKGALASEDRKITDEVEIKARIKARLNLQDQNSKEKSK